MAVGTEIIKQRQMFQKKIVEIFKSAMAGPPHRKQIHQRQEVRKGKTSVYYSR